MLHGTNGHQSYIHLDSANNSYAIEKLLERTTFHKYTVLQGVLAFHPVVARIMFADGIDVRRRGGCGSCNMILGSECTLLRQMPMRPIMCAFLVDQGATSHGTNGHQAHIYLDSTNNSYAMEKLLGRTTFHN